jgi:putative transposase
MTGLSEMEVVNIGTNVNKVIETKIKTLNKIKNNPKIKKKIKKKNEKTINRKIYNKVDDLHWKTIKFLTDNFNTVLIGNMSAKQIVKKSNKALSDDTKTACLRTRFYEFRQRLNYKCNLNKVNYVLVDECYTSKICSNCGNYNDKLKGEKIYNCKKCNTTFDRDVNACRNIFMKSLMK